MFMDGDIDGKEGTMIMSITGNIDLKKISKLTKDQITAANSAILMMAMVVTMVMI